MAGSMRIPLLEADAADASAERLTRGGVPWPLAYLLCPWMEAVNRVGPGMTPWLRETTRLTVLAQREWAEPTTTVEVALERARAASEALAVAIDSPGTLVTVYEKRMAALAALYGLIVASRQAMPSAWATEHGLGW